MTDAEIPSVETLMDRARYLCKTDAELARQLNTTRANVADVRASRRGLTAAQCVALGLIVGEDPRTVLAIQAIEREPDEAKRGWLRRAFFLVVVLGVAPLNHQAAAAGSLEPIEAVSPIVTRYTLSRIRHGCRRWLRWVHTTLRTVTIRSALPTATHRFLATLQRA